MSTSHTLDIPEKTTSHPRYYSYEDSGVEWLGKIPEHWQIVRLKFRSTFKGGGTPSKDNRDYWSGDIPWVSPKDMKVGAVTDTEDHITLQAVRESSTSLVAPGSVLVVVRSGILKHTIPVATNEVEVALNQDLKAITPDERLDPRYLAYLIRGKNDVLLLEWTKSGTTVESLEHDRIANTQTPIPPLPEQRAIAAYLDRETERIDALVEKKERLIELLEEKRTALISHAVTKGLDDDAEMKDSGVEWLGEIPAAWEVVKFSHYFSITQGQVDPKDEDYEDRMLLAPNHIESHTGRISELETAREQGAISGKYVVHEGDIVYSKIRPELNKVCIAEGDWLCSADMYPIKVDKGFESKYLKYFLLSQPFCHRMVNESMRVAMPKVNRDTLSATEIIKPPRAVQRDIVNMIENRIVRIDSLTDKVRDGIARLKEYRTALISAAVTGQIDVREGG